MALFASAGLCGGSPSADDVEIVYPVHPNPNVRAVVEEASARRSEYPVDRAGGLCGVCRSDAACARPADRFGGHSGRRAVAGEAGAGDARKDRAAGGGGGGNGAAGRHRRRYDCGGSGAAARRSGRVRAAGANPQSLWRRAGKRSDSRRLSGSVFTAVSVFERAATSWSGSYTLGSNADNASLNEPSARGTPKINDLLRQLSDRVVGQPQALTQIVPYVQMHQAGLAPEGRPVGVFLLLGPTGTGKTRTVEVLARLCMAPRKAC